jgi:hypothetical protein
MYVSGRIIFSACAGEAQCASPTTGLPVQAHWWHRDEDYGHALRQCGDVGVRAVAGADAGRRQYLEACLWGIALNQHVQSMIANGTISTSFSLVVWFPLIFSFIVLAGFT